VRLEALLLLVPCLLGSLLLCLVRPALLSPPGLPPLLVGLLLMLRRLAAEAAADAFAGALLLPAPPLERPLADPLPAAAALGF
jgi:hypothetical protein